MKDKLIVIIDPQWDFINPQGNYARRHSGINQILAAKAHLESLLSSVDDDEAIIVYSNYQPGQFDKGLNICIPQTVGHQIDLDIGDRLTRIPKSAHSCFSSALFIEHLRKREIKALLLCGFLAEYCVKQTALDGLQHGYDVAILTSCIGTGDDVQERKEDVFKQLDALGVKMIENIMAVQELPPEFS